MLKVDRATAAAERSPLYDGWESDEYLRHARRVLGKFSVLGEEPDERESSPKYRLDAGHNTPSPHSKRPQGPHERKRRDAMPNSRTPGDRKRAFVAWMTLLLGLAGFTCGVSLTAWSMHTGRQDLWTIGTPIAFAGQIVLVMGLVLQLDRVWRDSRWAVTKMETVDEQLQDLKTATVLLNTTHGPSSAFYAHWAGGAGPEILLGDLKSQLDLLAVKLAQQ